MIFAGPDPDDLLDETTTDSMGRFQVAGSTRELTPIDPILKIYTDCNDGIRVRQRFFSVSFSIENVPFFAIFQPCQRKIRITLPNSYINQGRTVTKWYELGVMNVEAKHRGEERDCIH
jgi:hypothetical protein